MAAISEASMTAAAENEPELGSMPDHWDQLWYDRRTIRPSTLHDQDMLVKVWLKSIENIVDLGFDFGKDPDPYVMFEILSHGTPRQTQRSSVRPSTLNPEVGEGWVRRPQTSLILHAAFPVVGTRADVFIRHTKVRRIRSGSASEARYPSFRARHVSCLSNQSAIN